MNGGLSQSARVLEATMPSPWSDHTRALADLRADFDRWSGEVDALAADVAEREKGHA